MTTLSDIVQRLTIGVMRSDLASTYPKFVNEALTEIQRRRSWLVMKKLDWFTVPQGSSSKSLATNDDNETTNFKELTVEQSPIHLQSSPDLVLNPCDVWTREKILRRQARLISNSLLYSVYMHPNSTRRISIPVWIAWESEVPMLNILYSADSNLPFQVSYYGYLSDLVADGDHNLLTDYYPEMVIAKAKSLAFASINDPAAADFEEVFEKKFREAVAQDAYQTVAGLQLRM